MAETKHVVVVGAGFAGLNAVAALSRAKEAQVTLVDRGNFHLFQPLLYQVATAGLEASQIAFPIRSYLRGRKNVRFVMGSAERLEPEARLLWVDGQPVAYDYLVLAAGTRSNDFGLPGVARFAVPMKGLGDAEAVRNRLVSACEEAALTPDPRRRRALLTVALVGGGPTGVELAGAFAEVRRHVIRRDIPHIEPEIRIVLIEGFGRVLGTFSEASSRYAERYLERQGVELRVGDPVAEVRADGVRFKSGEFLETFNVIWAAGVTGVALPGLPAGRGNRVVTSPFLNLPERPEVYVAGDLNALVSDGGKMYPQVAQTAIQQGRLAGENLLRSVRGQPQRPFRYKDKGNLAVLGRNNAVAEIGKLRLAGFLAWVVWLAVHLYYLIGFRNRFLVLFNWAYSYLTYDFAVRLLQHRVGFPMLAQEGGEADEGLEPPLPLGGHESSVRPPPPKT